MGQPGQGLSRGFALSSSPSWAPFPPAAASAMEDLRATYQDEEDDDAESPDDPSKTPAPDSNGFKHDTTEDDDYEQPATLGNDNDDEDDNPDVPPVELPVGIGSPHLEPEVKPEFQVANGTPDEEGVANGTPDEEGEEDDEEEDEDGSAPRKKQKPLSDFSSNSSLALASPAAEAGAGAPVKPSKKSKKKNNNVWTKSTSRKGKKKAKIPIANQEDAVLITPIPRFPDKSDDSPDSAICLSKIYKAEKVELSDDRLSAGSSKGYRMVRATRGVQAGAWYFEIKVAKLGPTGHTRLGWSMEKGDLQAPVGYDGNSFGYRDMEGTKVHKAVREKYGEGYAEGDVIGFYINFPDGDSYAPKPPHLVWYKGQRYAYPVDGKEEPPKVVPGSEISFFKNGVCQGVAFTDLFVGRYYPAASMFTSPNQPNCVVKFNFGPDFEFFPQDFGVRPKPSPMSEVPYHGFYGRDDGTATATENGVAPEKKE